MIFQVGEFWWTRDELQLLKIVGTPKGRKKNIRAKNHIPNGYVYRYNGNGELPNEPGRNLHFKETDQKKIDNYYKDPEHTWRTKC